MEENKVKATELMFGDFVEYNLCYFRVFGIQFPSPRKDNRFDGKWIVNLDEEVWASEDELKPIQITEEWLVRLGFEKTLIDDGDGLKRAVFQNVSIRIEGSFEREGDWCVSMMVPSNPWEFNCICTIWHIHQLQNLYFSLNQKLLMAQY